jgi:hypothetical protein
MRAALSFESFDSMEVCVASGGRAVEIGHSINELPL